MRPGRAARNVNGRAILYADTMTGSMETAIGETNRRRQKQIDFNEAHGITPQTVQKRVADVMEGARVAAPGAARGRNRANGRDSKPRREVPADPKALGKFLAGLEEQMLEHARNLEFEEAARLRDEIHQIREEQLVNPA